MLRHGLAALAVLVLAAAASPLVAQTLPADLRLVQVASGFQEPVAIKFPPDGSRRMFVVGRLGRIDVVPPGATAPLATPFLRLAGTGSTPPPGGFRSDYENGLLGFAFHPQFASNGYVYVHYNDANNDTVIARYTVSSGDPNRANAASVQVILRIEQESSIHKGGDLVFGPDGFLYIAMGDGADQGDPCERAETVNVADLRNAGSCAVDAPFVNSGGNPHSRALLGKVLRIDINNGTPPGSNELCGSLGDGSAPYAIPGAANSPATIPNPYLGSNVRAGNCDEIWSYGWRNPWRFSFDRDTGDMFLGDVGWDSQEEVSLDPAGSSGGGNYGWDACEGTRNNEPPGCAGSIAPIFTYARSAGYGSSVTGGYVYRGAITRLQGLYLFGDYMSGWLLFLRRPAPPATSWTLLPWRQEPNTFWSSFGEDTAGELYVADYTRGRVLRITSDQLGLVHADGYE